MPLLPILDEENTYQQYDFSLSVYHANNATVLSHKVSVLICPSTSSRPMITATGAVVGLSSYVACHHDSEVPIDADNNGIFFLNSKVCFDEITDGSSHTIFVGEKFF